MKVPKRSGLNEYNVHSILIEEGTHGGHTYHIKVTEDDEPLALCWRSRKKDGKVLKYKCGRYAGLGTQHPGTGACRRHGGNAGAPIKHGGTSYMARQRLADKVDYMLENKAMLSDMSKELATAKALFEEMVDNAPTYASDDFGTFLHRITNLIGTIGTLVDKISKIDTRTSLTAAQVVYLRATMIDVLIQYIDPEQRAQVIEDILFRMGGSENNAMEGLMLNGNSISARPVK